MAKVEHGVQSQRYADVNVHADMTRNFQHVRAKMLHCAHVNDVRKMCCGRVNNESYSVFKSDPESAWPMCILCWGR